MLGAASVSTVVVFVDLGRTYSSSGIVKGVPVPRATGETLSDCRADIVHASMSIPVLLTEGVKGAWVPAGGMCDCSSSVGGGTEL